MTAALSFLIPLVGVLAACVALAVPRASYYRSQATHKAPPKPRPRSHRALTDEERSEVLRVLDSERFADHAPRQVYAALLDEDLYLCSVRTMYRILAANEQCRERRNQRRHPTYVKPELVARGPNEVWTWDTTKVPGPKRGAYYTLYVSIDIYSRYVTGWAVAQTESSSVAQAFLTDAFQRQNIRPGMLTCHSDRGAPMTAKSTALLYSDLGITSSLSRPHVSDDNPFSEAAFRTFLYRPEMPERFGCVEDARQFFASLFRWYNQRHYHSGIALLTPEDVHLGEAATIVRARQRVLDKAYKKFANRFVRKPPTHPRPDAVVWINPSPNALT